MLETLAGRLKWERTGLGIRVVIPARLDWWIVPAALFATAVIGVDCFYLFNNLPDVGLSPLVWICIVIVLIGGVVFICWFLWSVAGKTILAMDPFELKLEHQVIGIECDSRRFATYDVKCLRYIPPVYIYAFQTDTNPATSKIQFQAKGKTIRFARGITEREACALFDRMMEIYKFPKNLESDSAATIKAG
jgi:hypothetical protein